MPGGTERGVLDEASKFDRVMALGRVQEALRRLDLESGTWNLADVITSSDGAQAAVRQLLCKNHPSAQLPSHYVLFQF